MRSDGTLLKMSMTPPIKKEARVLREGEVEVWEYIGQRLERLLDSEREEVRLAAGKFMTIWGRDAPLAMNVIPLREPTSGDSLPLASS